MRILKCDICGCSVSELATIVDIFNSHEVKEMCSYCQSRIDKYILSLTQEYNKDKIKKVKAYIIQIKENHE